jgi:pimeloyl-ACP methyl ester carboxylesterase
LKNDAPIEISPRGQRSYPRVDVRCASLEKRLLFYPSHREYPTGMDRWVHNGQTIGYTQTVSTPRNVWLLLHGNAGQAEDRAYALPSFSPEDSVYILEYPGYGKRPGVPSKNSFNAAATEAYLFLRETFPKTPVCVATESIGSGPGCSLAAISPPPDKIVMVAPFDSLTSVAHDHFPGWMVKLLLKQKWDNVAALSNYKGPVQIFAAKNDTIIHPSHARALANSISNVTFIEIEGGHNDWTQSHLVKFRNP